jgi:hypothetical protein
MSGSKPTPRYVLYETARYLAWHQGPRMGILDKKAGVTLAIPFAVLVRITQRAIQMGHARPTPPQVPGPTGEREK